MKSELINLDLVLLANKFNPAIVTKDWLISKTIFTKEPTNFFNTIELSGFETEEFSFQLNDIRLILKSKLPSLKSLSSLKDKIGKFVISLPETPYTAIGFNVAYRIIEDQRDEGVLDKVKQKFCKDPANIENILGTKDYRFGFNIINKIENIENTIQISPNRFEESFLVNINYHLDLIIDKELSRSKNIEQLLNSLRTYFDRSEYIVNSFFGISKNK